ncbi:MAG: DMT family transporter [Hyphomicrobiales bacterium]
MSQIKVIDDSTKGMLLTFGFVATVPFVESSVKLLGGLIAPPQIAFTRFMLHVIVLSIYIFIYIPKEDWVARPSWPLILRGVFASIGTLCVYAGLALLPLVDAVSIFFIQPIIITALSAILLREKVGIYRWGAVLAGMIGALLVIGPNFDNVGWGAIFPALAALFHGLSALITRKWANAARLPIFQYYIAITAVIIMGLIFIVGDITGYESVALVMPSNFQWFLLSVIAFGSIITNLLLTQAFRIAPSSVVAPFLYLQIIGSTIMGLIIFDQLPSFQTIVGSFLVVSAGLVIWWREKNLKAV